MWIELDELRGNGALEEVLPRLQAIAEFVDELDGRLVDAGVDGVEGTLGLYRRLRAVLDAVPEVKIACVVAEVEALARRLAGVRDALECVRRLKASLGA